jgi:GNAT superfamily N-acetyltransferase
MQYSHDINQLDFATVHDWLSQVYWSPGISRERVERAFRSSAIVIGAFAGNQQVGVARCVTDTVRFAYIADVYVAESHRRQGIATEMVRRLLAHPLAADADSCYLLTKDAHDVYRPLGFEVYPLPDRLMARRKRSDAP